MLRGKEQAIGDRSQKKVLTEHLLSVRLSAEYFIILDNVIYTVTFHLFYPWFSTCKL